MLEITARLIDSIVRLVSGFIAAVLLLYSGYVLYDNFSTNRNAFSSWDLLRYKPVEDINEDEGFQELLAINPDVKGWISIFDSNIDYPVLQGKDNMEYVNKDVYGNFSLSGAIYIASECVGDFSDPYSLVYGHHMENGAMFGGIDNFAEPEYFSSHKAGLIQTRNGNYDLRAFACVRTDAYESLIYSTQGKSYADLSEYIRANAISYDQAGAAVEGNLVALSTCADIETYGRLVLFCKATRRAAPLPEETEQDKEAVQKVRRMAMGHGLTGSSWAVLNLVCVLLTLYTLFPVGSLRTKYRQIGYSKRTAKRLGKMQEDLPADKEKENPGDTSKSPQELQGAAKENAGDAGRRARVIRDLRRYVRIMTAGLILEAGAAAAAVYLFYITEDFRRNMGFMDRWTPYMIGLFALALLLDFICFRYRGARPEEIGRPEESTSGEKERANRAGEKA